MNTCTHPVRNKMSHRSANRVLNLLGQTVPMGPVYNRVVHVDCTGDMFEKVTFPRARTAFVQTNRNVVPESLAHVRKMYFTQQFPIQNMYPHLVSRMRAGKSIPRMFTSDVYSYALFLDKLNIFSSNAHEFSHVCGKICTMTQNEILNLLKRHRPERAIMRA